jgi:hypothetical protein
MYPIQPTIAAVPAIKMTRRSAGHGFGRGRCFEAEFVKVFSIGGEA